MKFQNSMLAVLSAVALVSSSVVRADDKPIKLVRTYKVGDVTRTKTVVNTSVMGMDIVVNQNSKTTVKEVKENGDAVLELASEGGTISVAGMEQEQPAAPPSKETRSKLGKLLEFSINEAATQFMSSETQKLLSSVNDALFTTKEIKPSDSWETELDNPMISGKKFKVKTVLVSVDKVDGVDVAKLKQTVTADVDKEGGKLVVDVTFVVSTATGELVKTEGTIKGIPTNFGPMDWAVKSTKTKGDKKA